MKKPSNLVNWQQIDTVLLDMDGTLLDLHFDNFFWQHSVPKQYAQTHNISLEQSQKLLQQWFLQFQGQLNWYCLDFWSQRLEINILQLKQEIVTKIDFLPNADSFLQRLQALPVKTILATNAHRDSIALKHRHTQLLDYLDDCISAHDLGFAKEQPQFWQQMQDQQHIDLSRTLFIDDSDPVLTTAYNMGVSSCFSIQQPDTQQDKRKPHPVFHRLPSLLDIFND